VTPQSTAPKQETPSSSTTNQNERATMFALINGYRISQMLAVVATLRIADHVQASPQTVSELARLSGANEESLYRVLRTLAGFGVFHEGPERTFALTPLAATLVDNADASLRTDAQVIAEEWSWRAWGGLLDSVRTGRTAFDAVYGQSTWEWFQSHPNASALFNNWMLGLSRRNADSILNAIDATSTNVVVDVGGGHGALLRAILHRHEGVRGVLFDTPHVIASARSGFDADIATRVAFVSGDCFLYVPAGGDVYLLKDVLHDWTDERSLEILRQCRRAMDPNARLLIIEHLVGAPNQRCAGKVLDIQMMVRQGGRNRTEDEFRKLLNAAELKLVRIVASEAGPQVLVVTR
jgi:hypothetical protein